MQIKKKLKVRGWIPDGRKMFPLLRKVQTDSGTQLASYKNEPVTFPEEKDGPGGEADQFIST
jgi:hypothetical protein